MQTARHSESKSVLQVYKRRNMTQTQRENETQKKRREVRMSVHIQESRYVSEMSVHIQQSMRIRNVCPHLMSVRIQSMSESESERRSSSKCHRPISIPGPATSAHLSLAPDTTSSPDTFERKNADSVVANHQARPSPPTMQNPTRRPRPLRDVEPRHVRKTERKLGGRESPSLALPS